jgi:hypothetical protein
MSEAKRNECTAPPACSVWTYGGRVDKVEGRLTCPHCTKIVEHLPWHDLLGSQPVIVTPVFLVRCINSKTQDWFWGCPNFPECKYSKNRSKTEAERTSDTRAWANSLYPPNAGGATT